MVKCSMALFHTRTQVLTRSKGHNTLAAVAYRRAITLKDERTGITFTPGKSSKERVIYSEIMLPADAPQWILDICELQKTNPNKAAELLWNSVEKREKRKDSQLARELNIALPLELNKEQCILLVRDYAQVLCDEGMVADFSIHWDKGNPHVHIMVTMRRLTAEGWGNKERAWNKKFFHETIMRERIADISNKHLAHAGFSNSISHLSYAARGIPLEPTVHEGNKKNLANQQARERNKKIRLRNLAKIVDDPAVLLDKLSKQNTYFTVEDIAKSLNTYIESANDASLIPESPSPSSKRLGARVSHFIHAAVAPLLTREPKTANQTVAALHVVEPKPSPTLSFEERPLEVMQQVFEEITRHESVFNEKKLVTVLSRFVANPETVAEVLVQIKASPELLAIGPGEDGRERYTTREMFDLENNLQELAEELSQKASHKVNARTIKQTIKKFQLSDDQAKAIRHVLKGGDLSLMVGPAGAGKSYSFAAAKAAWEASGYTVYGVALPGAAADRLAEGSGIKSSTIDSFYHAIQEGRLTLTSKDIIVMDEAGMTDILSMAKIMILVKKAKAKLVLVGDPEQLQSIGPGAIFRALLEGIGFAELTEIRRQKEAWQREATAHFAAGRTEKALEYYEKHNCIFLSDTPQSSLQALVNDWADSLQGSALVDNLMLAFENKNVEELNRLAREKLKSNGLLKGPIITQNENGAIEIAVGERLVFLQNSWFYGVRNGQKATIIGIQKDKAGQVVSIEALLDGKNNKMVNFNPQQYEKFAYGYATTVHCAQGNTVLHSFVLASSWWNKYLSYVAMSRHVLTARLYGNKESHLSISGLKKSMSRWAIKDSVLDYPLAFAARRGIELEKVAIRFQKQMVVKLKWITESLKNNFEETFFPARYWAKKAADREKQQIVLETLERRQDAKLVAAYVDANCEVGIAWAALEERQKALEIDEKTKAKEKELLLKRHPTLITCREALIKRDEIAAQIYSESGRYTKALEIYGISLEKLENEQKAHVSRNRVIQYLAECKEGRVVHRDKLAFLIQKDFASHYNALLALEVPQNELKCNARAHERRDILRKLSLEEREDFNKVESYIRYARDSSKLWNKINEQEKELKLSALIAVDDLSIYQLSRLQTLAKTGKPLSRELIMKAKETNEQRDTLAAEIYQHLERYKVGLDFYEFNPVEVNSDDLSDFDKNKEQWAKERFEKLKDRALQVIHKEDNTALVQDYIVLLNKNDESRFEMANKIIQDKKVYCPIVFDIIEKPRELFIQLHSDARAHQRNELLKVLKAEERDAFLEVERYLKERKEVRKIWGEAEAFSRNYHPIVKEIASPHALLRDEFAYLIAQEPDKYQEALGLLKVDLKNLQKDSDRHLIRQQIIQYLSATEERQDERRDELAANIYQNIKLYYTELIEQNVCLKELKINAKAEERRLFLKQCSLEEQQDFNTVEHYIQVSQECGKLWGQIKVEENSQISSTLTLEENLNFYARTRLEVLAKTGKPILREVLTKAQALTKERDALASLICQDLPRYQAAFKFYEIGSYVSLNPDSSKFDKKATQWAKERLEKLEKRAVQFNQNESNKQYIYDYIQLLNSIRKRPARRYNMAIHIVENIKKYYPIIFEIAKEPLSLLNDLYQDVRASKRNTFLKDLSAEELSAFLKVEQYVKENKVSTAIWHETKDFNTPLHPIVKEISDPHTILRDELAESIYTNPELYQHALSFFKLKVESLGKKAFYHQVRTDLAQFKKRAGDLQARMALARKIVSNRSAYTIVKDDAEVGWNKLQNYADYALKLQYIDSLTPKEKEDYYSVFKYKRLRREAGKLWGHIFKQKKDAKGTFPEKLEKEKAVAINAERDQLAFIIQESPERFDNFLALAQVQVKDIQKHALSHKESIEKRKIKKRFGNELEKENFSIETNLYSSKRSTAKKNVNYKPKTKFVYKKTVFNEHQLKRMEIARDIAAGSVPLSGTLAENYLKEHRGIVEPLLEESVRFNASVYEPCTKKHCPALIIIARNEEKEVQSVHCIYLDENSANKMNIHLPKRTWGPLKDTSVLVQRGNLTNQFVLAKGLETALSVAHSDPALSVWVSLGVSFANIPIPLGSNDVLLCAGKDEQDVNSLQSLNRAIGSLSERGLNVYVAKPLNVKEDFNDVYIKQGKNEVKRLLDRKVLAKAAMTLEQLIENKHSLRSDVGKMMVEFVQNLKMYKHLNEPQSLKEVERKVMLFEEIGKMAILIKEDILLKEAAHRHNLYKDVAYTVTDYIEQQKYCLEAKSLSENMKIEDPIQGYLEAIAQKAKLIPSWNTQSPAEKEQWIDLNDKIEKLAFLVDKNPINQYKAKELGIYKELKTYAYQWQQKVDQKLSLELGTSIGH